MPRVEQYTLSRIKNAPLPDAHFSANASPDAFGAGIGRGLQDVAQAVKQKQHEDDVAAATDAYNKFSPQAFNLLYGDGQNNQGYLSKQGKDAQDSFADFQSQLSKLRDDSIAGLSESQKRAAQASFDRDYQNTYELAVRHSGQQRDIYQKAVDENYIDTNMRNAAISYNDPEKMTGYIQTARQTISDVVDRGGYGERTAEMKKSKLDEFDTKLHATVIDNMIKRNEFERADQYYNGVDGKPGAKNFIHDATMQASIEGQLAEGVKNNKATTIVDEIYSKHTPINELSRIAREKSGEDTGLADEAVRRLKIRRDEDDAAEGALNKAAYDDSGKVVLGGASVDSIPRDQWAKLSFEQQKNLKDLEASTKAGARKTDLAVWTKLNRMAIDNPKQFASTNLLDYANNLDQSDFQEFGKLQRNIAGGDKTYLTQVQSVDTKATKALQSIGVKVDTEKGQLFMRELQDRLTVFEDQEKRKATPQEVDAKIDELLIDGKTPGFLWNHSKKLYQVKPGEEFSVEDAPRVPDVERKKIVDALKRRGINPTEEMISSLYVKKATQQ